jgi:hypothetical protein
VGTRAVGWGLERLAEHAVLGNRRRGRRGSGLRGRRRRRLRRQVFGGDGANGLGMAMFVTGSLVLVLMLRRQRVVGVGGTHLPPASSLLVHGCGPLLCLVLLIDTRQAAQLLQQVAGVRARGRRRRAGALLYGRGLCYAGGRFLWAHRRPGKMVCR